MTGLNPITQLPATGPAGGYGGRRDGAVADRQGNSVDRVAISETAQRASEAAAHVRQDTNSDVRADMVARAKANLEEGTYRLQQVVLQVAARVGDVAH